jgi:hypothetical protein
MACPLSLDSICAGKRLTLYGTVNEPGGTTYGIASSEDEVFVVCRWPDPAAPSICEQIAPSGAQVTGEAAIYRVESD